MPPYLHFLVRRAKRLDKLVVIPKEYKQRVLETGEVALQCTICRTVIGAVQYPLNADTVIYLLEHAEACQIWVHKRAVKQRHPATNGVTQPAEKAVGSG